MTISEDLQEVDRLKSLRKTAGGLQAFNELLLSLKKFPQSAELNYLAASICDVERTENEAVPFYLKSLELGLSGNSRRDAYLGLASTYRCLGNYPKSKEIFMKGIEEFPSYRPYYVFLALTENNLGNPETSIKLLLEQIIDTTSDQDIKSYERALRFYSTRLKEIFE